MQAPFWHCRFQWGSNPNRERGQSSALSLGRFAHAAWKAVIYNCLWKQERVRWYYLLGRRRAGICFLAMPPCARPYQRASCVCVNMRFHPAFTFSLSLSLSLASSCRESERLRACTRIKGIRGNRINLYKRASDEFMWKKGSQNEKHHWLAPGADCFRSIPSKGDACRSKFHSKLLATYKCGSIQKYHQNNLVMNCLYLIMIAIFRFFETGCNPKILILKTTLS